MNLQNISEGQTIKNYKELCKLLEINEEQGNSKVYQIKDLERFLSMSRNGHSFIIDKIYGQEIERGISTGSRTLYVDNFSIQLLHELFEDYTYKKSKGLAEDGVNYMFKTPGQLAKLTGMVNNDYKVTKLALKDFVEERNYYVSKFDVDEFYKTITNKINSTIKTSMKILEDKKIIVPYKRHLFKFEGKQYVTGDAEETMIADIQNKIYNDMGFKGMFRKRKYKDPLPLSILSEIYLSNRGEEFYTSFNKEIWQKYQWNEVYSGWKINFHTARLEENISRYEREYEILIENKIKMNEKFVDFMNRSSESKYNKTEEKYRKFEEQLWGEVSKKEYPFRYEDDYVQSQSLLTDIFVKIK